MRFEKSKKGDRYQTFQFYSDLRELQRKNDPHKTKKHGGGRSPPPCFLVQLFCVVMPDRSTIRMD